MGWFFDRTFAVPSEEGSAELSARRTSRLRHIDRKAGQGLEVLGHAIEYLMDEYLQGGGKLKMDDAELEAVELLMARNREIYISCPVVPTLRERFAGFWERYSGCKLRGAAHQLTPRR